MKPKCYEIGHGPGKDALREADPVIYLAGEFKALDSKQTITVAVKATGHAEEDLRTLKARARRFAGIPILLSTWTAFASDGLPT